MKYKNILIFLLIIISILLYFLYKTINTRPTLYCCWTGTNKMSEHREKHLKALQKTQFNVVLVTKDNLDQFIDEPLHEGYQYLSETHKADYLRTYFMHFYGGGYSDIKSPTESWINTYNELYNDSNKWIAGIRERSDGPSLVHLKDKYEDLIVTCAFISKPNTPLTQKWYSTMMSVMDSKLENLKKYPSRTPQEVYSDEYPYPLKWTELLGDIYHPLIYEYREHVLYTLPSLDFSLLYR